MRYGEPDLLGFADPEDTLITGRRPPVSNGIHLDRKYGPQVPAQRADLRLQPFSLVGSRGQLAHAEDAGSRNAALTRCDDMAIWSDSH